MAEFPAHLSRVTYANVDTGLSPQAGSGALLLLDAISSLSPRRCKARCAYEFQQGKETSKRATEMRRFEIR